MSGQGDGKRRTVRAKGKAAGPAPVQTALASHGWTLLAHPLFLDQLESLTARAEAERAAGQASGAATKLLGHVLDLVFDSIPQNPGSSAYRHGGALAGGRRDWFRGKTGNGRFRLFFRYHGEEKIIVYAWLNDERSLRTTGARNDVYAVFAKMLAAGNPPHDWAALRAAASTREAVARFADADEKKKTRMK